MRKPFFITSALAVALATLGVVAYTQTTLQTATQTAPERPVIDPAAIAALDRMGTYLRSLKSFQVQADQTKDEVLEDGQIIELSSRVDLLVAPNRFRADLTSDRKDRLFLYDGQSFTLFARRMDYYATVPAPATTAELSDVLDKKYDIQIPLDDMFRWGTPRARTTIAEITAAGDYGPSAVNGTNCQHYAFRQEGLDWQIWIQNGEFPLPRKVSLTTLTDESRPQFTAVYTWQLAPAFNEAAFTFTPPPTATKIVFAAQ